MKGGDWMTSLFCSRGQKGPLGDKRGLGPAVRCNHSHLPAAALRLPTPRRTRAEHSLVSGHSIPWIIWWHPCLLPSTRVQFSKSRENPSQENKHSKTTVPFSYLFGLHNYYEVKTFLLTRQKKNVQLISWTAFSPQSKALKSKQTKQKNPTP